MKKGQIQLSSGLSEVSLGWGEGIYQEIYIELN